MLLWIMDDKLNFWWNICWVKTSQQLLHFTVSMMLKKMSLTAENPCELNCMPRGENFFYRQRSAVVDGTPCHPGRRDICVGGVCKVRPRRPSELQHSCVWEEMSPDELLVRGVSASHSDELCQVSWLKINVSSQRGISASTVSAELAKHGPRVQICHLRWFISPSFKHALSVRGVRCNYDYDQPWNMS